MAHPVLPKLKRIGNKVTNFNQAGAWEERPRQELENLSDSLDVTPIQMQINSIPDMWARPLLFEMALFDTNHVLHQRVLGEWRGLLALLALKEVEELQHLEVQRVAVPTPAMQAHTQGAGIERNFLTTLAKLLPQASMCSETNWRTLFLILFNGRPIGMTSPTTLVVTATDCLNRIQGIGWFDSVRLGDPTGRLATTQKNCLAGWLSTLMTNLGQHPTLDTLNRGNSLLKLLGSFLNDLQIANPTFNPGSSLGITGLDAGVFIHLDTPAARVSNGISGSHVRLVTSSDRDPSTKLLVVEEAVADQWRMQPQDVAVYGALTLDNIPLGGLGQNHSQLAHIQLQNAQWRTTKDFFTSKLAVIAQDEAFPGALPPNNSQRSLTYANTVVTPLLPLKKELISYLGAQELNQRTYLEVTPKGIKVRLQLPLSGTDGAGRNYVVEKLYQGSDILMLDANPILEVWPNFQVDNWKAYYTCYSTDNVESTFEVEPFVLSQANMPPTKMQPTTRARRRFWQTESYPEAMLCHAQLANADGTAMVSEEVGMLLLSPPTQMTLQNRSYRVGIDFGASSTSVYTRIGNAKNPVVFQDRRRSVTKSGTLQELYDFFLPIGKIEMPFLSLYQDFLADPTAQELKPFLDGHIYFFQDYTNLKAASDGMATDLKWSEVPQDRIRVRAFLTQLCLQIAAEAAASGANTIDWAFSYPSAFTENMLGEFAGIWDGVTERCSALTGLQPTGPPKMQTESIAAAMFFREEHNASTDPGAICIDIGGSTSDISIWQGNRLRWQTSLRLAGRDIFLSRLWSDPSFLEPLGMNVAPLQEIKQRNDKTAFYSQADALLRQHSKTIFENLPIYGGTLPIKMLKQHLALGLSGLFYYVGSVLHHLMQHEEYANDPPNVYVGGNGSRMFRWLGANDRSNELFKALFARGAGWSGNKPFSLIQSKQPKAEAAYGLVCDSDLQLGDSGEREVLAGENFREDGQAHGWEEALKAERFTKKLEAPSELSRLKDFLTGFNEFVNREGTFDAFPATESLLTETKRRLGQSLSRYRGQTATANVLVEPVFILGLKHLLDMHNDQTHTP